MSVIQMHSGTFIDLADPQPEDIHLEDIAHNLSRICRFTGSTSRFYSVAEHSLHVMMYMQRRYYYTYENILWCLLHDASEAYLGDVSTPLKNLLGESYKVLEANMTSVIARKFGLREQNIPICVKNADYSVFKFEVAHLMPEYEAAKQEYYGFPSEKREWNNKDYFLNRIVEEDYYNSVVEWQRYL